MGKNAVFLDMTPISWVEIYEILAATCWFIFSVEASILHSHFRENKIMYKRFFRVLSYSHLYCICPTSCGPAVIFLQIFCDNRVT